MLIVRDDLLKAREAAQAGSGNHQVNASVQPISGSGIQDVGMFAISVGPKLPTNTLVNVQWIVQTPQQLPTGDFEAFVFVGANSEDPGTEGLTYSGILYASWDAVQQNRDGTALYVTVTGGVNVSSDPFFFTFEFTENLWPTGP